MPDTRSAMHVSFDSTTLSRTRVGRAHHVLGVKHLLRQLRHGQRAVLLGATRRERREAVHEEMPRTRVVTRYSTSPKKELQAISEMFCCQIRPTITVDPNWITIHCERIFWHLLTEIQKYIAIITEQPGGERHNAASKWMLGQRKSRTDAGRAPCSCLVFSQCHQ